MVNTKNLVLIVVKIFFVLGLTSSVGHTANAKERSLILSYQQQPIYHGLINACPELATNCVIKFVKHYSKGLCVDNVISIDNQYWKKSRKQSLLPQYVNTTNAPITLPVQKILFMQASASLPFNDLKRDIIDTAKQIKSGKINVTTIPAIEVWQDKQGRVWTINHRRLITMILAGIPTIHVQWSNQATVLKNKFEFTTTNGGKKINVWVIDEVAMVINNNGRCLNKK